MQKTGQITNIVPDGGYQGQNGYINTFQMTIQCPDGIFTGQIGSKSQTYPTAVGQQITFDMTTTERGVRFKKINPKYAQDGQQAPQQPAQDKKATPEQELTLKRGYALNAVMSATTIPSDLISDYLAAGMNWFNNGVWNLTPPNFMSGDVDPDKPALPPPDEDESEIPF